MNNYWDKRYKNGGNSGAGSYGHYATHKAEVINKIIVDNKIEIVTEYGCGDGNQLGFFDGYKEYYGYDISPSILEKNKKTYENVKRIHFCENRDDLPKSDLSLSLDVAYHIMDEVDLIEYLKYMFSKSKKYVLIYTSNHDDNSENTVPDHMIHRIITNYVDEHIKGFELINEIDNPLPSSAKFFLYKKTK